MNVWWGKNHLLEQLSRTVIHSVWSWPNMEQWRQHICKMSIFEAWNTTGIVLKEKNIKSRALWALKWYFTPFNNTCNLTQSERTGWRGISLITVITLFWVFSALLRAVLHISGTTWSLLRKQQAVLFPSFWPELEYDIISQLILVIWFGDVQFMCFFLPYLQIVLKVHDQNHFNTTWSWDKQKQHVFVFSECTYLKHWSKVRIHTFIRSEEPRERRKMQLTVILLLGFCLGAKSVTDEEFQVCLPSQIVLF